VTSLVRYQVGVRATFKLHVKSGERTHTLRHLDGSMLGDYAHERDMALEACIVLPSPSRKIRDRWDAILAEAFERVEDHVSDAETNPILAIAQEMSCYLLESEMAETEADMRIGKVWQDTESKDIHALPRILVSRVRIKMTEDKPTRAQIVDASKVLRCETKRPTLPDGKRARTWAFPYAALTNEVLL
jgi:hypothetical protein